MTLLTEQLAIKRRIREAMQPYHTLQDAHDKSLKLPPVQVTLDLSGKRSRT
jgi:hypothetical protein